MLLLKRMRQRASVFVALFVVAAIGSALLVGIVGMLNAAEADGVRAQLRDRSGADRVLELSLRSEPDAAAQNARVEALAGRIFTDGDRVLPVDVTRTIVSDSPVSLSIGVKAFVASVPDLDSHAALVEGEWPQSPGEASVQADAASALGIAPGDELDVGEAHVVVTGLWRVSEPLDPRWVSDPLFLDGHSGVVLGPIVVAEDELPTVAATTNTRWAIVPRVEPLRAGDLDLFLTSWSGISDSLRADGGFNVNSLHLDGRFATVATTIQSNVNALGAVAPVALLIVASLTILTIVELARLLATVRSAEYLLFWSRGDTVLALTLTAAAEAASVTFIGAALGTALATVLVGQPPLGWAAPVAVALVASTVFAVTTAGASRTISRGGSGEESGRSARITGVAAPVLVTVGAVISTWQLLLYGSPLSPTRDGGTKVDPIAVIAPALGLLALVAIATTVLPLVGRLLDRAAARSTGRALVVRTLARRTRLFVAALVLCALATGQLTIAAAYAQTWDAAYSTATALRAGSNLTIEDLHSPLTEDVLQQVVDTEGVDAVAPVYSEPVSVGATRASMVAITPRALTLLATDATGLFDPADAATQIALPPTGPTIPHGARELMVTVESDTAEPVELTLVIADELGMQREVEATGSYRFELPGGTGDWNVLALIVHLADERPTALTVTTMVADGTDVDLAGGWTAAGFDPLQAFVTPDPTGAGFIDAFGLDSVRLTPLFGNFTDVVQPPVLVSQELAATARIRVGDTVPVTFDARSAAFGCVVAGIVPAIPGAESEPAVLIDASLVEAVRARFYETTPTPNVAWIEATDPTIALDNLGEVVPAGVVVSSGAVDANRGILAAAARALWLGAVGASLLCFIAVTASVLTQERTRRDETFILRALGVSDREIAAGRQLELALVVAVGLLVGLGAGLVVAVLTIGPLARAAVPGSYNAIATSLSVQPFGLAAGLLALVIGFAIGLVLYGRRVSR
jgi:hypothetical protein